MSAPRPTAFGGLFTFGCLVLGLGMVWGGLSRHLRGPPPEKDLTVAEGVAIELEETWSPNYGSVSFRVGDHRITYSNSSPKYREVLAAVKDGLPVRIWVSIRQTWLGDDKVLYQLTVFGRTVLSYRDVTTKEAEGPLVGVFGGIVLAGLGACGTLSYVRGSGPQRPAGEPASPDEAGAGTRVWLVWGVSTVLYAFVIVQALTGQGPPAALFWLIVATGAFLPVPWFVWGAVYLSDRSARDRRISVLWTAGLTEMIDLHLRRARVAVSLGLAYLLLLATGWVAYTAFLAS